MELIFAISSTIPLVCLSVYIFLLKKGGSFILYSTISSRLLTFKKKIFIALSAIGFFICLYNGAEEMLSWIPSSIGSTDEFGDFHPLKDTLVTAFTFIGGFVLIEAIDKINHYEYYLKELNIEKNELIRIIEISDNERYLGELREGYDKKIEELELEILARDNITNTFEKNLLPEQALKNIYLKLQFIIDNKINKIQSIKNSRSP